MNTKELWQVFMETGAPEMYLLYNRARKMEESHVFDSTGIGSTGNELQ